MKQQILKLRQEGKSYKQIKKLLNCSMGTISYHCSNAVKIKSHERNKVNKRRLTIFKRLNSKVTSFKVFKKEPIVGNITTRQILEVFGEETICYLTGDKINLINDHYHFDHIIPASKGGTCNIDNLGITIPIANYAKSNLSLEELFELCKKILTYNGYEVTKNEQVAKIGRR